MFYFITSLMAAIFYFIAASLLLVKIKIKASSHYLPTGALRCLFCSLAVLGIVYFMRVTAAYHNHETLNLFVKEDCFLRIAATCLPALCILTASVTAGKVKKILYRKSALLLILLTLVFCLGYWWLKKQFSIHVFLLHFLSALCLTSILTGFMLFVVLIKNLKFYNTLCKKEIMSFKAIIALFFTLSLVAYLFASFGVVWPSRILFASAVPLHMLFIMGIITKEVTPERKVRQLEEKPPEQKCETWKVLKEANEKINQAYIDVFKRVVKYMEAEHPYRSPFFSREEMATAVGTNTTYLSHSIRLYARVNFKQFINAYRVMYAQEYFLQFPNARLIELCNVAGFRSLSALNQAFHVNIGMTPGEWCKRQRNKKSA